ncbi:MAG TPA: cyclic peptide export ABC transporter [Thermoanaerobaculia bacterium]|nr:cyclic peptide export ABC transporter [Thermoanaerobaculia bacterium]
MKLIYLVMRYSKGFLVLAILVGALSGLANAGLIAAINEALARHEEGGGRAGWFFALCLGAPLASFASGFLLIRVSQRTVYDLRISLSRRIVSAPLRLLEQIGPHRLLAALTQDVATVSQGLTEIPLLAVSLTVVLGCLGYMAYLSLSLFLVLLGLLVVGLLSYRLPSLAAARRLRQARDKVDSLYGFFRSLTDGIKELKLHSRRRQAFLETLDSTGEEMRELSVTSLTIYKAVATWGAMLVFLVVGLFLFAAPRFWEVSRETVTGFVLVLLYMSSPLQGLMASLPQLSRANVSLAKIEELGLSLAEAATPEAPAMAPAPGVLELAGVTHTYYHERERSNFTLGPIDLAVHPGEILFLVGGNGSGKTTLAKVLAGLYAPEGGEVRLGGKTISEENRQQLRDLFSAVFSDFHLFPKLFGLDGPDLDERARAYLARLELDHKVQIESGVVSTTDLSQGQRKRLALLTAFLEDRSFYLFDEWAADQDPYFKEIFYHQLLPELQRRGKTVVVISHDDRYYDVGDRVIKLDSGKLVGDFSRGMLIGLGSSGRERQEGVL